MLELECYQLKSGEHHLLSFVWGIRERQRRTRQCLERAAPKPVGPERETGSRWLIPVGATVSHKAEMHSLLLSLLKIHHVFIERAFFFFKKRTSNLTSFLSFF